MLAAIVLSPCVDRLVTSVLVLKTSSAVVLTSVLELDIVVVSNHAELVTVPVMTIED